MVASRPDRWSHLHLSLRRAAAAAAAVWLWAAVPAAEGSPLDWDVAAAPAAGVRTATWGGGLRRDPGREPEGRRGFDLDGRERRGRRADHDVRTLHWLDGDRIPRRWKRVGNHGLEDGNLREERREPAAAHEPGGQRDRGVLDERAFQPRDLDRGAHPDRERVAFGQSRDDE